MILVLCNTVHEGCGGAPAPRASSRVEWNVGFPAVVFGPFPSQPSSRRLCLCVLPPSGLDFPMHNPTGRIAKLAGSKFQMHRTLCLLAVLLTCACVFAQTASAPADPYKPVLDRLQSITVIPLPSWQSHAADLAHGEDPAALSTSGWTEVKLKEDWHGSRWLRAEVRSSGAIERLQLAGRAHRARLAREQRRRDSGERFRQRLDGGTHRRGRASSDHAHPERSARSEAGAGRASPGLRRWRLLWRKLNPDRARRATDRTSVEPSRSIADALGNSFGGAAHRRISRRKGRTPAAA